MEQNLTDGVQKHLAGTRVTSIDALRGFSMFWLIGGGTLFANLAKVYSHPVLG